WVPASVTYVTLGRSHCGDRMSIDTRREGVCDPMMDSAQRPLELILARNLLTSLSTPAFLADADGALVFYNEAAGALLGMSFEESGKLGPREWSQMGGPLDCGRQPK